jgi:Ca2+-dependent lipid-binding protein
MPSTLKIRVVQARDLPIMDKQHESTDAYVQVKFGDEPTQQTDIVFRSLHPVFNADFRIEIADDIELQDHPIVFKYQNFHPVTSLTKFSLRMTLFCLIRVWDKDTYSSDDSIGTVIVDLNPLLIPDGPTKLTGWFPVLYINFVSIRFYQCMTLSDLPDL